jgi:hypothetical protein
VKERKREETTMRMVGLTGGIASGKSTVSRQLQAQGIPVIDADKVAQVGLSFFLPSFLSSFLLSLSLTLQGKENLRFKLLAGI